MAYVNRTIVVDGTLGGITTAANALLKQAQGASADARASADIAVQAGNPTYNSRAEAEGSNVPAPVQVIRVASDGVELLYGADVSGTALLTNNGSRAWAPLGPSMPHHFGPVTTAAGFTASMQTMMAWLASRPAPRFAVLPAGSYALNAGISVPAETTVRADGAVIDISTVPTGVPAFSTGNAEGTRYPLTANLNAGASTATLNAADLQASTIREGSWVRLTSNAIFDPTRTSSRIGEMAQIRSVDLATGVVTFGTPVGPDGGTGAAWLSRVADTYLTADAASISDLNVVSNVHFTGSAQILGANAPSVQQTGMQFQGTAFCSVQGWSFHRMTARGIYLVDCTHFTGDSLSFRDFLSSGTGYGISVAGASQDLIFNGVRGHEIRHLFSTNNPTAQPGIPRRIMVDGFVATNSRPATTGAGGDAMDAHAAADFITFSNGVIRNPSGIGINIECPNFKLLNVDIHGSPGRAVNILNYTSRNGRYHIRGLRVFGAGASTQSVRIGPVAGAAGAVLEVDVEISVYDSLNNGLYIAGVTGNYIRNAIVEATVNGYSSANGGVMLDMVQRGRIKGGSIRGAANTGDPLLRLRETRDFSIMGLTGEMPTGATGFGITMDTNTASINIVGCNLRSDGAGTGLRGAAGVTGVVQAGNILSGFATPTSGI